MENNEENLGSQEPVTGSNPVKTTNTKLIGIITVAVAVIAVILLVFFMFFTRSAASTVKSYVKAIEKANAKKVMALVDVQGTAAFDDITNRSYSGTTYDFESFEDKYEEEMDNYKDMDKDEKKDYEDNLEDATEFLQDTLDEMKDSDIKFSVKDIDTEKVDDCKMLTKVTCTLVAKHDGEKVEQDVTFYTMKKGLKHYIVSQPTF